MQDVFTRYKKCNLQKLQRRALNRFQGYFFTLLRIMQRSNLFLKKKITLHWTPHFLNNRTNIQWPLQIHKLVAYNSTHNMWGLPQIKHSLKQIQKESSFHKSILHRRSQSQPNLPCYSSFHASFPFLPENYCIFPISSVLVLALVGHLFYTIF